MRDEHPGYDRAQWVACVLNDNLNMGYEEWVEHLLNMDVISVVVQLANLRKDDEEVDSDDLLMGDQDDTMLVDINRLIDEAREAVHSRSLWLED